MLIIDFIFPLVPLIKTIEIDGMILIYSGVLLYVQVTYNLSIKSDSMRFYRDQSVKNVHMYVNGNTPYCP